MDLQIAAQAEGSGIPWLSLVTLLPLFGALLLTTVPRAHEGLLKGLAFGWSLVVFGLSLGIYFNFAKDSADFQLVESHEWIKSLGIRYALGVDGISLFLVLLSTFLTPIILLGSWTAIEKRVKEFLICFLVLETAMIGALVSLDIFLFYVFWELMLIPMYLLIGVWGGSNRIAATVKFFLMTAVGSLLMLVAIFYLYFKRPEGSPRVSCSATTSASRSPRRSRTGSSPPSPWPSPSRCRWCRSTPGCPAPTPRPRRPAPWCSPACS